jgi:hypothetical protein
VEGSRSDLRSQRGNLVEQCLSSKSAGLINDATLKSLFLGVSDGFQRFAALLRFIGTPSLSEFPSPLYTTIHQDEHTKLSTYINRLVAHAVLMSQSGIMYSERYFFHLLVAGLYVKTPTNPSMAHPQGVALAVSIQQLIDRQDINRPLGSEYSLSNLLTLVNSRLFDIGYSSYLTTTPRDALIRQNQLPKPLRPPMVPTPTSPYVPRPPGNALSPRPSNFAAQPSRPTSYKSPAKPVHALAAIEAGEGYGADAYAYDGPHDEFQPSLENGEASLENPTDADGQDFR